MPLPQITCQDEKCQRAFTPAVANAKYCSWNCKMRAERRRRKARTRFAGPKPKEEMLAIADQVAHWFQMVHNPTTEELANLIAAYKLLPKANPSKITGELPEGWMPPPDVLFERDAKDTYWTLL